ncbi:MAG: 3-isopropylmalate dehydratase large subunit [Anaerolineaceae bacterium]|nr:3-isopropylmalate dehydratase large subunit [Anaerolineaceae bacterium]
MSPDIQKKMPKSNRESKIPHRNLFEKIWEHHVVVQEPEFPAVLYIDLHLIHEITSPQAFTELRARGLRVRRPDLTFATIDHAIPTKIEHGKTTSSRFEIADELSKSQIQLLRKNCKEFNIELFDLDSKNQGIVHVIGPELGLTRPGMTIVCGDSHTATHGAFGALAFGIGTSEVAHVMATQSLLQRKPKTCEIQINGSLKPGVAAKDIILALINKIGVSGGRGHIFEYSGSCIESLDMEERMTICNMSIEAGARAGLIAPDDTTYEYLSNKDFAPKGHEWDRAVTFWKELPSDEDAIFGKTVSLDVSKLEPMITFGTNPSLSIPITGEIPNAAQIDDHSDKMKFTKALDYMGLQSGKKIIGQPIDVVFIGSCTNSRISDLRAAAQILKNRRIASGIRVIVVPGSQRVKKQAESEKLDRVFLDAGAEWREPGCSMCIAMNGDQVEPGQYVISTSNRNFKGRQGKGSRTFLASPYTAAATAVNGKITDVRTFLS